MTKGFDIPPDAVRVWRGYRANNVALQDFFAKLGTVFVPATVEMQIAAGLDGYVPSIPAGLPNKPDAVPDETAILFWDSQETYKDAFDTLAVRTYTLTHGPVYRPPSTAQFPVAFAGTVVSEMPYYLVDRPADWMHGKVTHLIGERSSTVEPDEFRTRLAAILSEIQHQNKVLGAIVCAGDDYFQIIVTGTNDGAQDLVLTLDLGQNGRKSSAEFIWLNGRRSFADEMSHLSVHPVCRSIDQIIRHF